MGTREGGGKGEGSLEAEMACWAGSALLWGTSFTQAQELLVRKESLPEISAHHLMGSRKEP